MATAGTVDTDMWLTNLKPFRPMSLQVQPSDVSIFEVPKLIRDKFPECFQTQVLQLGLQNRTPDCVLQNLKVEIASVLLNKLKKPAGTGVEPWEAFVKAVVGDAAGDVAKARGKFQTCTEGMSDEAVQHHLTLDALFVVFFFQYLNASSFSIPEFKTISDSRTAILRSVTLTDFLVVENQIPMFLLKNVVRELCKIIDPALDIKGKTVEVELDNILRCAVLNLQPFSDPANGSSIMCRVAQGRCVCWRKSENEAENRPILRHLDKDHDWETDHALEKYEHILDCVYGVVCGHASPPELKNGYLENIPSATSLEDIGIKVEHSTDWTVNCVKLNGFCSWIRSSRLGLPKLKIYDNYTSVIFRNLAVYEHLVGYQYEASRYRGDFRCFLKCMRDLCRDIKDVELLSKRGILDMNMSHADVVSMWGFTEELFEPIPSSGWTKCYDNIHKHRKSVWKTWRRSHLGTFFGQPWKVCSVFAAIVLLLLTFFQTWFTMVNSGSSKARWPP